MHILLLLLSMRMGFLELDQAASKAFYQEKFPYLSQDTD